MFDVRLSEPLRLVVAFLAGALTVAAFAPLLWWWLVWPPLVLLFSLQLRLAPRPAFRLGFAWGLGLYVAGISWIYVSLHIYGGMPLWMGALAVLLFASVIAVFAAFPCYLAALLVPRPDQIAVRLLVLVCLWTVFEWAKSWVLTGFPWLDLGYTQTPSWVFALAPVGGVYLVSFYVALSSAMIAYAITRAQYKVTAGVSLALVASILGLWSLEQVSWSVPSSEPVQVGIVQPNTLIDTKWQPNSRDAVMRRLSELSEQLAVDAQAPAELIVWPETALALYYQQTNDSFWQQMVPNGASLITGLVDSPAFEESYNAAILVCDGEHHLYRKRHLVPFGEYLPLRFLFNWVLEYLDLPMSDFSAWDKPQPLSCGSRLNIGLSICYEDAFAEEHRVYNRDSTLLVNISEDAWFGDSLAPHQRLQIAQMRARELSRPMLRSANSGPSAVINERGVVVARTAQFEVATLSYSAQPQTGATLFARLGNWVVYLSLLLIAVVSLRRWRASAR